MSNCTFDTSQLDALLSQLNAEKNREIIVNALKAGGEVLRQNTADSLLRKMPTATDKMVKGIKTTIDKDYMTVIVSILKEYRLKWYEKGTVERYRKIRGVKSNGRKYVKKDERGQNLKGGYTGKIEGRWFFKEARENEGPIIDAIVESAEQQLNALFR